MKIKICGLNQPENIESVCALCPDYIGMIFYELSPRCVHPGPVLRDYIRSLKNVQKVGVFVNASPDAVIATATDYRLDCVQLHGDEDADTCRRINNAIPVIKAFRLREDLEIDVLKKYEEAARFFLFDTWTRHFGGSGQQFNWDLLRRYDLSKKFFLSGGIGVEDADRLRTLAHPHLEGIDANSRLEDHPGIKNIDKVKHLIHELRNR